MMKTKSYWQQNMYILTFGNFIAGIGFSMVTPFLSLYINTLGHFSNSQISFWSGITYAATFIVSAFISPFWGKLADQKGRKLIILRASLGMSLVIGCMSLVTNVYQLVALRALQGFFAGYISNSNTLIATTAPQKNVGKALGTLSMGTVSGNLLGPLIGGVIAQVWGYRLPFLLTGILLMSAFFLCLFFVKEDFTPVPKNRQPSFRLVFQQLKNSSIIWGMFFTTLIIQLANNSINPIISLYVSQLMHHQGHVALMSGLITAIPGIPAALLSTKFGSWGDQIGTKKVLLAGLLLGAIVYFPQSFVTNVWQLFALRFLVGISDAALLPQVQTLLSKNIPHQVSGRIFGYNQSFQYIGSFTGPLLGAAVSGVWSYGAVFFLTSILELGNLIYVRKITKNS
ncbi:multidrug efflux MFS transporter [Lactobacillus sp. DCY120]|uniref:Multidrug efflux MFS transporter n=1 Tax=Bombilactobacillus apium TaxID=2675299 RepID=A0A850R1U9_9LACO|nr:multidrug efflux MFS transporter [Bombilactobacillus apium]NVY96330.1 multidrug efflux MFS transporter [Bombilactobacillus apium]